MTSNLGFKRKPSYWTQPYGPFLCATLSGDPGCLTQPNVDGGFISEHWKWKPHEHAHGSLMGNIYYWWHQNRTADYVAWCDY